MNTSPCVSCGATLPPGNALDGLCPSCLLAAACDRTELPDSAGLDPGASLGPYEIVSALGQGGMGQVYLGWDTRLCRTVAIKVLAAPLASDPERTRRLEGEARILAGLNHPRICAVHDIGCESGLTYIVMEHLDGETLAERLTRGVLPIAQVIRLGVEIAEGLDGAHRHGITHRDLKPANIMITPAGVKVLDFGLASRGPGGREQTIPHEYSRVGGTLQYMAPEQLDGKSADVRSDVFAFGLVLREMLGDRSDAPPALARIVQRCLRLDPEERWQSLRDVLFELMEVASDQERPVAMPMVDTPLWRSPRAVVSAAIVAVLMSLGAGRFAVSALAEHNAEARAIRFTASLPTRAPDLSGLNDLAFISPDGRLLVWVCGSGDGKTQLAVQVLATSETTPLADTDGALWPFWSPDSRTIGFFTRTELRTVKASGGPIETVAKVVQGAGGSWSARGTIVFAPGRGGPLYEVPERGGEPTPVTTLDRGRGHRAHLWPTFLSDGRRFIYFASSSDAAHGGLYLGELGSNDARWIAAADGAAVWAAPRHLLFTRAGMLMSQAVNPATMTPEGDPHVLQQRVCGNTGILPPCFSASSTGILVYHVARLFRHQFSWFNRGGRQTDIPIEPGSYFSPVLSPDGMRVAIERHDPQTWQLGIWQFDLTRQMLSRVLDNAVHASGPLWSPDGRAIAFSSNVETRHAIYVLNTDSNEPQQLFSGSKYVLITDWSTDRERMLFQERGDVTKEDVWVLHLGTAGAAPTPVLQSRFSERQARFSPDGRWIAYSSDESGQFEVYVQPFPPTGRKWQVSNDGGREPTWRRDGRELFYLAADRRLMAAPVRLGRGLTMQPATELFRVPADAPRENRFSYAPTADGQRFLVNVAARDPIRRPLFETEVIVNWTATLHD